MIQVRRAGERGFFDHGWLKTSHTFSFSDYYDPNFMGFRVLRVINEDLVAPGRGFPTHGHRDMEIVTYLLGGALQHRDSMGNGTVIRPGEVQRMSAGTGVQHSEFNPSASEGVHLLQIWILPSQKGITPSYEQTAFSVEERRATFRVVASPTGEAGSVTIHQDAKIFASILGKGESATATLAPGRFGWVQVARGAVTLNGVALAAGDGVALAQEAGVVAVQQGEEEAELLLFDLP